MSTYVTINEIVKNSLIDIGENTEHLYQRCLHWAFEGLKDFHFDTAKEIKTVSIPMRPTKAIDFPADYVDWVKIGIVAGDRVLTFAVNHKIELREDLDECGKPTAKPTTENQFDPPNDLIYYGGYWFSNYCGNRIFGYGGACHNIGFYRINWNRRQIQFGSEVSTSDVYLEYITNGVNPSGESVVNPYAAKLVKLYILWMRKEHSDKYADGMAERARQLYYNELRLVRARLSSFDIADFILATQRGYMQRLGKVGMVRSGDATHSDVNCSNGPKEDCADVFPETVDTDDEEVEGLKKRFWGIDPNPSMNTSAEILSLLSEFADNRMMTKTLDATGGNYLYFAYPVDWGQGLFIFNTFPTTFLEQVVPVTLGGQTEDYYLYRSLNLQHGNSLIVQIQ